MNRRIPALLALAALLMLIGAPAASADDGPLLLATAEMEDGEEVSDEPVTDVVPAVEAEATVEEEEDQPWTARFLAPTVLAVGFLGVVAAIGYYVVRIRGRYRVVS